MGRIDAAQVERELTRARAEHDEVDTRWFGYETDLATILDFPMMIDMREPLTVEFHKAKRRADLLRPEGPTVLPRPARRPPTSSSTGTRCMRTRRRSPWRSRRRSAGAGATSRRSSRSVSPGRSASAVALDGGATGPERQQAYQRARSELEGLIDLPKPATVALERQVRAALER
ncbi:hypothetical protein MTP03_39000 [Tsukamurella sp. PLM1]|nr:hypothetical protein MTP03_39000 [Tsukamurella sp. PLM1]